jgi:F-type H+-transporting ATPase subunit alpha
VIFAGTNGVLDKIPVSALNRFEKEMVDYLEMKFPDILPAIAEEKVLSDELREKLLNAVTRFAENFKYEEE